MDSNNIVEGKRQRILSQKARKEAYEATLSQVSEQGSFHVAFHAGITFKKPRIHRTTLPPPPKFWNGLRNHPCKLGFQAAADKEYNDLRNRGTFQFVQKSDIDPKTIIPLMWVFTYKFDDDGYLIKYKARLVVQGDL